MCGLTGVHETTSRSPDCAGHRSPLPASAFLNDCREGVGSDSVALHFCFNPPRDYLGNLRLFSHVLVVTICDHGCIYPGWTMGQPPNRRCKQREVLFAADVILRSVERQYRARDSGDGSIRSLCAKEVLVLTRCVGDVKLCRSTDKRRRRAVGQPDQVLTGAFVHELLRLGKQLRIVWLGRVSYARRTQRPTRRRGDPASRPDNVRHLPSRRCGPPG